MQEKMEDVKQGKTGLPGRGRLDVLGADEKFGPLILKIFYERHSRFNA